jgi:hypothetical protein
MSVFMISSTEGWAVGTSGKIWRFLGGSWDLFCNPPPFVGGCPATTNDLNGVFISNPGSNVNAGWAVGDGGIVLKLTITGSTPSWTIVTTVPGITADLYGVYFTDANHGWIVGGTPTVQTAVIISTSDGGGSWSGGIGQVAGAPADTVLRSVFVDTFGTGAGNGDGWAVGDDGTADENAVFAHWNGAGWFDVPLSPPPVISPFGSGLHSVYLTSPTDGFAVGAIPGGGGSPLSAIFHLDPPNPPVLGGATSTTSAGTTNAATSTSVVTSVVTSIQTATSTTSATTSSATSSAATSSVTSSAVSQTTASSSVQTRLETQSSTAVITSTVTPSSETTALQTPTIPGFPWESIIAGIIVGLAALAATRRHKRTSLPTAS